MRNDLFANTCLVLIVAVLGMIAFRCETPPVYAAKKFQYEVAPIMEGNIATQIAKEAQAGWEPIAAPMWAWDGVNPARGFVIFRK